MRYLIIRVLYLSILVLSTQCGQKQDPDKLYTEADSLLILTLVLQAKIGAPEIQRLHDFEREINNDLELLSQLPENDTSLLKYLELQSGLGQCMQACNQYHEEAFLLESSLREIMEQVEIKDSNIRRLEELIAFEKENYMDLSVRIDSSLMLAMRQAERFYFLKPEIEKVKKDLVPTPEMMQ